MVLPIAYRELWEASRRRATFRARVMTAGLVIGVACLVWGANARHARPSEMGLLLFLSIGGLIQFMALGAGSMASDSISREKRDGTLGLLFLTDLKAWDIVIGKLSACIVPAFYNVLATVPVVAIPLMMGGVTPGALWHLVLIQIGTLFYSLCGGMLASALSQNSKRAALLTALFVLGPGIGAPALALMIRLFLEARYQIELPWINLAPLVLISPMASAAAVFIPLIPAPIPMAVWFRYAYWISLGASQVLALMYLASAIYISRRCWQDRPSSRVRPGLQEWFSQWRHGNTLARKRLRDRLLVRNPILWLVSRDRFQTWQPWLIITGFSLILGMGFANSDNIHGLNAFTSCLVTAGVIFHLIFKLWIGSEASTRFFEDQRSGALELLLATPMRIPDILRGHWMSFRRMYLFPSLAILAIDLVAFVFEDSWKDRGYLMCAMVLFVFDMMTLARVGLWMGCIMKSAQLASGQTIFLVLVVPWCCTLAVSALVAFLNLWARSDFDPGFGFNLSLWMGFSLVANVILWQRSGRWLKYRLRESVYKRFTPEEDKGWRHAALALAGRLLRWGI